MRDGDLAWTAERYVLGDLPDAEAEQFERTLAESQAAREAVAAAVSVCAATEVSLRPSPHRPRVTMAWIGAAAACIVVAAVAYFSPRSNQLADATHRNKTAIQSPDDWILALPEMIQDQTAMQGDVDHQDADIEPASAVIADDDEVPEWLIYVTAAKEGAP